MKGRSEQALSSLSKTYWAHSIEVDIDDWKERFLQELGKQWKNYNL